MKRCFFNVRAKVSVHLNGNARAIEQTNQRKIFANTNARWYRPSGDTNELRSAHSSCMRSIKEGNLNVHDLDFMKCILLNDERKWNKESLPEERRTESTPQSKIITIVLNNTICAHSAKIIPNSDILICADGGANRLYNWCQSLDRERNATHKHSSPKGEEDKNTALYALHQNEHSQHVHGRHTIADLFNMPVEETKKMLRYPTEIVPHIICGDFDSISEHVYSYYKNKSVIFEKCANQENTDLDKCIDVIRAHIRKNDKILILGATGNRFDHTCANISCLYKNASLNSLYLIGENNFLFLLQQGSHIIHASPDIFYKGCGILPIGGKCTIKTEGLKYNLNDECLSFDTLISSSNEVVQREVKIFTDSPVVWSAQLRGGEDHVRPCTHN
ncbi:thiamine pyrophosphokinase, putative [Plasmodium knowlesi strain H]|uniref:Thiamine pyrophosphokinase, putative n=3 Tax=Plasmodium knowlesi TaxID=5850 RepID=A0A5K1UQI9_PLAKH|nr:thiamine pyrophosphokinase, putative [Plasmodium knowlesi strain H]OTN67569.1 putative Thiamin pyrophosphokinase [Plasmodium knowlesi]CAA9987513.1 thiamine pyrophosphokinase, putative [Plasmodium knowlesi strain H]SBO23149.1 thiamine pyrophosphokinase, putative [Plasmodium knowlesi strain H]SBO23807.1 thiamine pyrophosphokinase, putative [Plasmodium knowlesi strain H]VVS76987.1 thiamine pyrophosphokinase, putative [Plasmodium knowlesi strain H]|eukprot:XP_002258514.1 thiamin pyrophosphokinase, putative [Plasmodium knowlesi strain H]